MKKIGILGGSFDPIHLGHLNLAIEMMEAHHLNEVWFCPAAANPLKKHTTSASSSHRLNMIHLAIENEPRFRVCDIEINREGPSYTLETLQELHALQDSPCAFYFIMGEDAARHFYQWHKPEEILNFANLLIGKRSAKEKIDQPFLGSSKIDQPFLGSSKINEAIRKGLTPIRQMEVSSTEIRERLLNKKDCCHLVPGKVLDYIITNDLYYSSIKARFL